MIHVFLEVSQQGLCVIRISGCSPSFRSIKLISTDAADEGGADRSGSKFDRQYCVIYIHLT